MFFKLKIIQIKLLGYFLKFFEDIVSSISFIRGIIFNYLTKPFNVKESSKYEILYESHVNENTLISLLCPTRGRINNIKALLNSIVETSKNVNFIEVVFYIDNDDYNLILNINNLLNEFSNINLKVILGDRITLSHMWNICYKYSKGDILMHCADDIIFKSKYWDSEVIKAFDDSNDKILFVYGSDGNHKNDFGTHGFLHRNWANILGYFTPPYFSNNYCDTWLNDVAKSIKRHQYIPILTDHLHPSVNKSLYDKNYVDNLQRGYNDKVNLLYLLSSDKRQIDALKLKLFILEMKIK